MKLTLTDPEPEFREIIRVHESILGDAERLRKLLISFCVVRSIESQPALEGMSLSDMVRFVNRMRFIRS